MRKIDPAFLLSLSELFINLSAGWFGAAFIVPLSVESISKINLGILTVNVGFGILCFVIGYFLKKRVRNDD